MRRRSRGFSLVEVVVALGVFASAIVVVLALLPALGAQAARAEESFVAQRFPDALRVELQRLAATGGFEALTARVPRFGHGSSAEGLVLVASRDGARLHARDYFAPSAGAAIAEAEQHYALEVWRFPSGAVLGSDSAALLLVKVRVSWPYRLPEVGVVALRDRSTLEFNLALRR